MSRQLDQEAINLIESMSCADDSKTSHARKQILSYVGTIRSISANNLEYAFKLEDKLEKTEEVKNNAYNERNKLVALISSIFKSSLERHPEEDKNWEDDWRWIVFVQLPTGQASWHIHDNDLPMFDHLPRNTGVSWDGHTTKEKYERVLNSIKANKQNLDPVFPSYCCQKCGVIVGWIGRFFQWIPGFHKFHDCPK